MQYTAPPFFIALALVCAVQAAAITPTPMAVDCIITPHRVTDLSSPVMGVLEQVTVDKSDRVEAGQVVARLESGVERAAVELARARSQIESEVAESEVNISFDAKRQKRMDVLFKQQTVSEDVRDEFEREARLASVRLQQAKDLQRIRQHELAGMQARLDQKTIRSPFDGYVLERLKNQGEYVEEQAILRIAQLDPLNVEAILPIELFGTIKPGMRANVVLSAFPQMQQQAEVVLVDAVGNAASGTFGVRLELPNKDNRIPAGLKCQAQFISP